MIFESPYQVDIPEIDILSFLFSSKLFDDKTKIWLDAADPSNYLTKPMAISYSMRIAWALRGLGIDQEDKIEAHAGAREIVIVFVENQIMIPPTLFGIICAGGINATCAPTATAFELSRQIQGSSPKLVICSDHTRQTAKEALQHLSISDRPKLLIMKSTVPFDLRLDKDDRSILTANKLKWEQIEDLETLRNRTACLVYSSGTTGVPKGVPNTHHIASHLGFFWGGNRRLFHADADKFLQV
jgi:4-coumarate--CoA ligase